MGSIIFRVLKFLWSEWHGHVCVFISLVHYQKITTGGLRRRVLFPKIATPKAAGDSEGLNVLAAAQPYIERRGPRKALWTRALECACTQNSDMSFSAADAMCSVAIFGECPALFSAWVTDARGKRAGQLNCNCCKKVANIWSGWLPVERVEAHCDSGFWGRWTSNGGTDRLGGSC